METRVFNVNPMIADMDPLLRRVAGHRIELATVQGAGLWPVEMGPGELEQILLALTVSACEGMPSGGTLMIVTRNVQLDEEYARRFAGVKPGDYVLLEVADTGPGLGDAVKARILESFLGPAAPAHATALAFTLAYGIVRRAGGHLELVGAPRAGTAVRIYLPRAVSPVAREDLRGVSGLPGGNETILIVEDEKSMLSVTSRVLARLGYGVLTATNGEEAMKVLAGLGGVPPVAGAPPAAAAGLRLLLADIGLPGMDGVMLAGQVRAAHPGTKVVFMTGQSADPRALLDAAGPDYTLLEKPFTHTLLAQTVRLALDAAGR